MNIKIVERHSLDARMRRALEQSEFAVHYQPQVDLKTGRLMGTEALIRWQDPERGMVPNDAYIRLAEETGLICKIGEMVLRNACANTKSWQEAGLGMLRVSVNLSAREFRQKNLIPLIASILAESGLEPQYLELEVTEATIMTNVEETERVLRELKAMEVVISVDGFGTGCSSVHYLKRFALDRLKIDRSFLGGIAANSADAAVTEAIIAMGRSLGLKVMAVGVEGRDQLEFLQARECDELQGYLVSRPLPPEALAALLLETGSCFELRGDPVAPLYRETVPGRFDPLFTT
jgi:EAL domain-containing protein (putative c-di-GMP-specific phosphodiesterase class I)